MTGRYRMWDGGEPIEVGVPVSGGENVMVPVIRAIVRHEEEPHRILLQRRADPAEPVFGKLEIPGGRWRSGESPIDAIRREVFEETGIRLRTVAGVEVEEIDAHRSLATVRPLAIVSGIDGAFPAIHVVLVGRGSGRLGGADTESSDVRWWSIGAVRTEMEQHPESFIPSSLAALSAYMSSMGSGAGR